MDSRENTYIELKQVGHGFNIGQQSISLFANVDMKLCQGRSYAITGPSGSGKSSLLMLMSGLEKPKHGRICVNLNSVKCELADIKKKIGFIFQQFHLLPELSALSNVALPLKLRGDKNAETKASQYLNKVGLGHRLAHKPKQLSGGEQQRVAIARALVFKPTFIFADEPTGNLDNNSASEISEILLSCCREYGAGIVIVTHSETLAMQTEQRFNLADGLCHAVA